MISVTVSDLSISNVGFVVFLKPTDAGEGRSLPIFIGMPEAQAIALELNQVSTPRPMTHDLLKNLLDILEARLEKVLIDRIEEGTFFAKLSVVFEGQMLELDARPSDSIALALRCKAPILVAEKVMSEAGVELGGDAEEAKKNQAPTSRGDRLKEELARAVKEERYEDAARLRDELRDTTQAN